MAVELKEGISQLIGIDCNVCEQCSEMKCPIFFIHSMSALIESTRNSESNYIISNGAVMLKNLQYRHVPENILVESIAKLMHECKGCFNHEENCIINLTMQSVYYLLFRKIDKIDAKNMPLSLLMAMKKQNPVIADSVGESYLRLNNRSKLSSAM